MGAENVFNIYTRDVHFGYFSLHLHFTLSHLADAFIQATYNSGIHKAIHLEEAIFNLFLTDNRRSLTGY